MDTPHEILRRMVGDSAVNRKRKRVFCAGGIKNRFCFNPGRIVPDRGQDQGIRMFRDCFTRHPDQCRRGTVAFQAAVIAAGARNAVQIKDHVAEFAADMMGAAPDPAVDNNSASDSGSDGDEHAGGCTRADTGNAFGQSGDIRVVVNMYRFIQKTTEDLTEGDMEPAHIRAFDDFAGLCGRNSGNADANGFNIILSKAGVPDCGNDAVRDLPDLFFKRKIRTGGNGAFPDDVVTFVHNADLNTCSADINANPDHEYVSSLIIRVILKKG